jgi:hypothetical protein
MSTYTKPKRRVLRSHNKPGTWPSARRQRLALKAAQRQRARRGTR